MDISERARELLDYLNGRDSSYPPTVREICRDMGIKSTSTVHKYLSELAENGLIEKGDGLNRAITLPKKHSISVPLIGVVTAGKPILAFEQVETFVPFEGGKGIAKAELFALRARGESMIKAGILDGDIIIVRRTPAAENGDIVVALINDEEATVKRFFKEDGHFRLQPENDSMAPIIVDSLIILGRVIALKREYQ